MAEQEKDQAVKQGMSQVLDGCAVCCDGVRREAQASGLPQETVQRLDEAIRICKDVAQEIRASH